MRLCLMNVAPGALKKLLALALEFFLRGSEACNARRNFFALFGKAFLSLLRGHFLYRLR